MIKYDTICKKRKGNVMAENNYMNFEELADVIWGTEASSVLKSLESRNNVYLEPVMLWSRCLSFVNDIRGNNIDPRDNFKQLQTRIKQAQDYGSKHPDKIHEYDKLTQILNNVQTSVENLRSGQLDKESMEFLDRFQFIAKSYLAANYPSVAENYGVDPKGQEQYCLLALSKIKAMSDEQMQYNCLGCFCTRIVPEMSESARQAYIMRANNKHVTSFDLYNLMRMYRETTPKSKDKIMQVFQDMDALVRRELSAELSKEVPNLDRIRIIVNVMYDGAYMTNDQSIVDQVHQIYNIEKLLNPNAVEYLASAPDARAQEIEELNARITELQAQVASLQSQVQEKTSEVEKLDKELGATKQTLEDARVQNQTLNNENSLLRQENTELQENKLSNEDKLKKLISGAQQLKGGIFNSRELDDFKRMAAGMEGKGSL